MACAVSGVFACLWCASGCSAQRVGAHFAFFPPEPPTYTISKGEGDEEYRLRLGLQWSGRPIRKTVTTGVQLVLNSLKESIAVFSFRVKKPKAVILFSHGNAMDCGIIFYFWMELAHQLNVDIYAYDYSGYGASTGSPSEKNTYADITAVYEHIKDQGVDPGSEIILYGQSVGTGPSCYLAAQVPVRGLVLHSPMTTGIHVISNDDSLCAPAHLFHSCDMFPNMRRIPHIRAPVYIMHGDCDEVIDVSHAERLLAKWPDHLRHDPYIVGGAGHDDIFEKNPREYFKRLAEFINRTGSGETSSIRPPAEVTMSA